MANTGANVTLTDSGTTVILANGQLTAVVVKSTAKISSLLHRGTQLVNTSSSGQIYYSMDGGTAYRQPSGCVYTVRTNTTDMVDIGMRQTWSTEPQAVDMEVHYVLRRGDTGIYTYALLDHPDTYPATSFGEWRMVWKIPGGDVFERLYVDALRNRQMPTAADYAAASPTGIPEILKLNTGVLAGQFEGKYCYNSNYRENPVWGHATDGKDQGIWLVLGAHEWFNDGPTKQDLAPAAGILHVHFGMNHYGGSGTALAAGEAWRKCYGPFLLYCNYQTAGAAACWADAQEQAKAEQAAWPYAWLAGHPDYPLASGRGTVTGTLQVQDALKPALNGTGAWVGLAAPDAGGNWQLESKRYQHWAKAGPGGQFTIPSVRPGSYTLYAFVDGATGEYERSTPVTVTAGGTIALGTLTWTVPRTGAWLVWEIGKADRTAAEFRHGTDYFTPYLWDQFSSEFANPLEYYPGTSNPAVDWNYAHSGYFTAAGPEGWKWRVHFNLSAVPASGNARLTLAFAGSYYARMQLYINDETNQLGANLYPANAEGNALLRQGIHAKYARHTVDIPVARLRTGDNVLTLLQGRSTAASDHVMYDYLSLEMPVLPGGTAADADADGMPDAWEQTWFKNLLQTASADADGDGTSNRAEFLLQLNPADPNSAFTATLLPGAVIRWQGASGLTFKVQRSTSLSGWTTLGTQAGVTGLNQYTDPAPATPRSFYRVQLVMP